MVVRRRCLCGFFVLGKIWILKFLIAAMPMPTGAIEGAVSLSKQIYINDKV